MPDEMPINDAAVESATDAESIVENPAVLKANQSIQLLVELVKNVNHLLCEFYQDYQQNQVLQISNKADKSPVTEADMAAHHLIEQGLKKINPLIPVLSEESSDYK